MAVDHVSMAVDHVSIAVDHVEGPYARGGRADAVLYSDVLRGVRPVCARFERHADGRCTTEGELANHSRVERNAISQD